MRKLYIETNYPVPSCTVHKLLWDKEKKEWKYVFEVKISSDYELGDPEHPLYLYGHILQLKLVDTVTKGSINLKITSIDDIKLLIEKQAEYDRLYREEWIKENPDYFENVKTIKIENKDQAVPADHIISVKEQTEDFTIFVISPKKGA